ncbi:MAG: hypothetical protein LKJ45_02155 [Oscillospiraceae bacterium]|nr:hypothetical protein [Oscillospiraceae bacterium]
MVQRRFCAKPVLQSRENLVPGEKAWYNRFYGTMSIGGRAPGRFFGRGEACA